MNLEGEVMVMGGRGSEWSGGLMKGYRIGEQLVG